MAMPAGTIRVIERKRGGFGLLSDPCPTCGIQMSINKVSPYKVELLGADVKPEVYVG